VNPYTPANLHGLIAAAVDRALAAQADPTLDRTKPYPCSGWCTHGRGDCTCNEPCQWPGCPMDVDNYTPPPVPVFQQEDDRD
jgi:hypothetical protein